MTTPTALHIDHLTVKIHGKSIINQISLPIPQHKITCIIGPSGSGKSTLLRTLNRINTDTPGLSTEGQIFFNGQDILTKTYPLPELRAQIGMVFQKPCVFPVSIKENVLFGIQRLKSLSKTDKNTLVEKHLKNVALWDEVSNRLNDPATALSIGQQQRLCIARTCALNPQIILLDEPTSALDPISTQAIEQMMITLKDAYTVVFVSHNLEQAKRIADHLVFISDGKLMEHGPTQTLLKHPKHHKTLAYLKSTY